MLFAQIVQAVESERFVVSDHADERLREREIAAWQVVSGIAHARLIAERPGDKPNPSVEVAQLLADGTSVKAVWSFVIAGGFAKLVTVHFFDW